MALQLRRFGPLRRLVVFGLASATALVGLQLVAMPFLPASATDGANSAVYFWLLALGLVAGHFVVVTFFHAGDWSVVGLGRAGLEPRRITVGIALGACAIGIPTAALLLAGGLRADAAPAGSALAAALRLAAFLVPAALWEELLMRGYLLTSLASLFTVEVGLAITSVIFGALHLQNPGATAVSTAAVTFAGFFLGKLRLTTGSLYAAFAAHFAWNYVMAAGFHSPVSGLGFAAPGWTVADNGPDWLTGGVWGPEGGAAAIAGMIGALWILRRRERRRSVVA